MTRDKQISQLEADWKDSPRWKSIKREYSAADLMKLRGSVVIEHTLARLGAEKLWRLVNQEKPLCALGALTGNQAIQEIQAGLKAIYCSGWQVAGDGNSAGEMYPDQSLYPVDSVPKMIERINNAFLRTDEIYTLNGYRYRVKCFRWLRHSLTVHPASAYILDKDGYCKTVEKKLKLSLNFNDEVFSICRPVCYTTPLA